MEGREGEMERERGRKSEGFGQKSGESPIKIRERAGGHA